MKKVFVFVACLAAVALVGCGNKASIKGKVTYSDGTPVPMGQVIFSTPVSQAFGYIQPNGTYVMEEEGRGFGLPPGAYGVAVRATENFEPETEGAPAKSTNYVDSKFAYPETSGLKFTVPSATGYDIVVERPSQQPAQSPSRGR